jgi:hypothetical protein
MKVNIQRKMKGSQAAELPVVLLILFVVILFPLIDLVSVVIGLGTLSFAADSAARAAGAAASYQDAQDKALAASNQIISGPLGQFAHLQPQASPVVLHLLQIDSNGNPTQVDPTQAGFSIDPKTYSYQYSVTLSYTAMALINLSSSNFLSGVPYIGAPAPVSCSASSPVEHLEGFGVI